MKNRILSLFLSLALLAAAVPAALAAESGSGDVLETLRILEVMVGDASGDLALDRSVSRAEFAKLLVASSAQKDAVGGQGSGYSLFSDVKSTHWASEYIKLCLENGWMVGYTDGSFRPDNSVTLEEACTAALRLLGFDSANLAGSFPAAQLSKASAVGLRDDVAAAPGQTLTRWDCAQIFYNLLTCKTSQGQVYAANLGYSLDADGNVDYLAVAREDRDGPFLASAAPALSFSPRVQYQDGRQVDEISWKPGTVYYTNAQRGYLWAYTGRVFGKVDALTPTAAAPEAVTVGGKSYALETQAVKDALAARGEDAVDAYATVLLGAEGEAAQVCFAEGPFTATAATTLDYVPATVYRDDVESQNAALTPGDVYYTCAATGELWVYTQEVYGQITALTPNAYAPTAVTVDGKSYALGTDEAKETLSALGVNAAGTVVTLRLGLDGQVAAVHAVSGPYIAAGGDTLPFVPATVYRDGGIETSAALAAGDVYYLDEHTKTLYVYTDRVSGKIEALTPNALTPTAVTISGKSYSLGTDALRRELSSLNGKWTGQMVTLLFGMDDSVVGVLTGDTVETTYYGVIQTSGKTAADGTVERQVTVVCTDGRSHTFADDTTVDWEAGDLVRVDITGGSVQVSALATRSIAGAVSRGGTRVGTTAVASDARVLDTAEDGSAAAVATEELDGLALSSANVRFYALNAAGEISELILNDATGALWSYGYLLEKTGQGAGLNTTERYTLLLDGQTRTVSLSGKSFPVTAGSGVAVRQTDGEIAAMTSLKSVKLTSLGATTASTGDQTFPLAGDVQVYLGDADDDYYAVELGDLAAGDYTLTGCYDTAKKLIRIIVAEEK